MMNISSEDETYRMVGRDFQATGVGQRGDVMMYRRFQEMDQSASGSFTASGSVIAQCDLDQSSFRASVGVPWRTH
jgi:hypothetical protein